MNRFLLALVGAFVASSTFQTAEACSVICDKKTQPHNASERAAQVRQAIEEYDYVFSGEVMSVGTPEPVRVTPTVTVHFTPVTIRPIKIIKGEQVEFITVQLVLNDGKNCGVVAVVGQYFRGLAKREPAGLVSTGVGCDAWSVFEDDGPLPDPSDEKPACR